VKRKLQEDQQLKSFRLTSFTSLELKKKKKIPSRQSINVKVSVVSQWGFLEEIGGKEIGGFC